MTWHIRARIIISHLAILGTRTMFYVPLCFFLLLAIFKISMECLWHLIIKSPCPFTWPLFCSSQALLMMMMMMMNSFCGMVDRLKTFSLISSRGHCERSSASRISDTPRAGFKPAQNLSLSFFEWICTVVITTTPRYHFSFTALFLQ